MSREIWGGVLWLGVALLVGREALRLRLGQLSDPGPGFIFFWSALVLGALALHMIITAIRRPVMSSSPTDQTRPIRLALALGTLAVYIVLFEPVGFIVATVVMIAVMLRLGGVTTWSRIAAVSVIATLSTYVLLHSWLQTRLPAGVLQ